jgi:hypothetical protein
MSFFEADTIAIAFIENDWDLRAEVERLIDIADTGEDGPSMQAMRELRTIARKALEDDGLIQHLRARALGRTADGQPVALEQTLTAKSLTAGRNSAQEIANDTLARITRPVTRPSREDSPQR